MEFEDHWMAKLFAYDHLPQHLKVISQGFHELAEYAVEKLPTSQNIELTEQMLTKLWEAKNLAVVMAAQYGDE